MTRIELTACDIIEIFEDFLEKKDIRIPSSDEEMRENGYVNLPEENAARIYGEDFDSLSQNLVDYLRKIKKEDLEEKEAQ